MTNVVEMSARAYLPCPYPAPTCSPSSRFKDGLLDASSSLFPDRSCAALVGAFRNHPPRTKPYKVATASAGAAAAAAADVDGDFMDDAIADDYYSVLGVGHDATPEEIKKAYHSCMKTCHPDLAGENADTTTFCMFINEVYEVLSDPVQRRIYDEINGYSLTSVNPFRESAAPKEHIFVDELSCIGKRQELMQGARIVRILLRRHLKLRKILEGLVLSRSVEGSLLFNKLLTHAQLIASTGLRQHNSLC